jgi:hypothetical protein
VLCFRNNFYPCVNYTEGYPLEVAVPCEPIGWRVAGACFLQNIALMSLYSVDVVTLGNMRLGISMFNMNRNLSRWCSDENGVIIVHGGPCDI